VPPTSTPTSGPTSTPTQELSTSTPTQEIPTSTPTATPTTGPSPWYQAEDASFGGGTIVETKNGGYHGTAYLNFPRDGGYVEFANMSGTGGQATLNIRYALGNTARMGELIVNGASQSITFDSTGSWTSWAIKTVTVASNSGANTIRLESTGQDLANIDEIQLVTDGPTPTQSPSTSTPTVGPTSTPTQELPTSTSTPTLITSPTNTPTPTPTPDDTEPPTVPINLSSPSQTANSIDLTWMASTDNVGVIGYDVYRDGALVGSSTSTSFTDSGLTAGTVYQYRVRARDAAGNASVLSSAITAETQEEVTGGCNVTYDTPSTWPGGFGIQNVYVTNLGDTAIDGWTLTWRFTLGEQITSAWNANVDQSGADVSATNVTHNGTIPAGGTVTFGFNGSQSNGVGDLMDLTLNGVRCGDTEPPTPPTNLSSPAQSRTTIQLTWTASTDNVGVAGYVIYRDGAEVGSSATTSFTDGGLRPLTAYEYTVRARDGAGNRSAPSGSITASTNDIVTGATFRVNSQGKITKDGQVFSVRCGSWFGLEGRHEPTGEAPMELYIGNTFWANGGAGTGRTIQQTMDEITAMGINIVRLPVAPQTLDPDDPMGKAPYLKNHPSVQVPNSRQALEEFIVLADQNGIEVLLDIHSCSNYVGWRAGRLDARPPYVDADRDNYVFTREDCSCSATGNPGGVTRIQAYDVNLWLDDLRTLAGLGEQLGVDNIIGIDIFNEPWDYTWEEWKALVELAYEAINEVNPNTLIFVEGISSSAGNQDGSPGTIVIVPHGDEFSNPNWGENLFEAGANPPNVPKERLVFSPHTYGPSVFVQRMFMDPSQPECEGLEGDAAGDAGCNIVIDPPLLRQGWEEHFGYLKDQGYAVVVGEFGGNLDWPGGAASLRDRARWDHITPGVDAEWQVAFVDYMADRGIEGCYWSINPESGDTGGWYGHAYDPVTNTAGWGEWLDFTQEKTQLLFELWGID
jgi:aryl-phospho-beta-D-glucosidase BglC (GH1 family)